MDGGRRLTGLGAFSGVRGSGGSLGGVEASRGLWADSGGLWRRILAARGWRAAGSGSRLNERGCAMRRVETRRNDSGREARRVRLLDDDGGAERTVPLFEVLDDAELRAWVRGFRAGKASAAAGGGKVVHDGAAC